MPDHSASSLFEEVDDTEIVHELEVPGPPDGLTWLRGSLEGSTHRHCRNQLDHDAPMDRLMATLSSLPAAIKSGTAPPTTMMSMSRSMTTSS
jgi:hypothetical protein